MSNLIKKERIMKKRLKTIALIVIPLLILMVLGLFVFKTGGGILPYFSGILYIATAINQHTGLNIWLARMIAIPFLVFGYYYGVRWVVFSSSNRKKGYISLIVVWCVICVSMFATEGSFSRTTGEGLKYYFRDDRGQIVLRDHDGVDAETGSELQKITPEIMKQYRLQQQGTLQVTDATLFDPETGNPLKRYYQAQDGTITVFPLEVKFHPEYGTKLELITAEVAVEYSKQPKTSPQSTSPDDTPTPVSLVPEEENTETASAEDIEKLNQEYQNRVEGQLDATHTQKEQESQEEFDKALDEAAEHEEKPQE
jgi:hypothetical protein